MGILISGVWCEEESNTKNTDGHYIRPESQFRNWIMADSSSAFPAEPGRYHLYIQGYYSLSPLRNPLGIMPKGPVIDFSVPHGRSAL